MKRSPRLRRFLVAPIAIAAFLMGALSFISPAATASVGPLEVAPASISDTVFEGEEIAEYFDLTNTSLTDPISIEAFRFESAPPEAADLRVTTDGCGASLPLVIDPEGWCPAELIAVFPVDASHGPDWSGTYEFSVSIDYLVGPEGEAGAFTESVPVSLVVQGAPRTLALWPMSVDFGTRLLLEGPTSPTLIQVYNPGQVPVTLNGFSVESNELALLEGQNTTCTASQVLAPDAQCYLEFQWTPTALGEFVSYVTVSSNAWNGPHSAQVVGLALLEYPPLTAYPLEMYVGEGTEYSGEVTVTNTSEAFVQITGLTPSSLVEGAPFGIDSAASTCTVGTTVLEPHQSCSVTVTITVPVGTFADQGGQGTVPGSLDVGYSHDGIDGTLTVTLYANVSGGAYPRLWATPDPLEFGRLQVGQSSTQYLELRNPGPLDVMVTEVSQGTPPVDEAFTVAFSALSGEPACALPETLATDEYCYLSVTWTPEVIGQRSFPLAINSTAGDQQVFLSGSAYQPIETHWASGEHTTNVALGDAQAPYGLPVFDGAMTEYIGGTQASATLTLTSNGAYAGEAPRINITGPFQVAIDAVTGSSDYLVTITFAPTAADLGDQTGLLTIDNDIAPDTTATITARGLEAVAEASITPSVLDFGELTSGTQSSARQVTITSIQPRFFTITGMEFQGAAVGNYVLTGTESCYEVPLLAEDVDWPWLLEEFYGPRPPVSCAFTVRYKPTALGTHDGSLRITIQPFEQEARTIDVGLYGSAVAPSASIVLKGTDSADPVKTGSTITYTFTITNRGQLNAAGVAMAMSLSKLTSLSSITASQGTCVTRAPVRCTIGSLAAGASAQVTVVAKAKSPGVAAFNANVTLSTYDSNMSDNATTVYTSILKK